jgi:hypothetical protein
MNDDPLMLAGSISVSNLTDISLDRATFNSLCIGKTDSTSGAALWLSAKIVLQHSRGITSIISPTNILFITFSAIVRRPGANRMNTLFVQYQPNILVCLIQSSVYLPGPLGRDQKLDIARWKLTAEYKNRIIWHDITQRAARCSMGMCANRMQSWVNGGFWMTRLTFYSVVCMVYFVSSQAFGITGMGLGARAGVVANYDNPDLSFEEARHMDIDQLSMVGGHFRIASLPVFTYEVIAEYNWHSKDYPVLGTNVSAKVRDFMLGLNLKYMLRIPAVTPYIGGGIASHQMTYEFEPSLGSVIGAGPVVIPDDGPRFGVHGLAGVMLGITTSPLEFFVEGRMGKISGDDESTTYSAVYGGVTLKLL